MSCVTIKSEDERDQINRAMDDVYNAYKLRMLDAANYSVCPTCHANLEAQVMIACLIEHSGHTLEEAESLLKYTLNLYRDTHQMHEGRVLN